MATKNAFTLLSTLSVEVFKQTLASGAFYFYIGKSSPWASDLVPDQSYDNDHNKSLIWRDMLSVKKITPTDTTNGFKRIDWVSGTVYDEYYHKYSDEVLSYSGATSLRYANYYVITPSKDVYICLSNNNNSPSTSVPTGNYPYTIQTSDGYKWKYIHTLDTSFLIKFDSPFYYPFKENNVNVKNAAVDGAIHAVKLFAGGSGYEPSASIPVFVDGDGILNPSAYGSVTTLNGGVLSVSVLSGGGMYPPSVNNLAVKLFKATTQGIEDSCYGVATTNGSGQIVSVSVKIPGTGYVNGDILGIAASTCMPVAISNASGEIERIDVPYQFEGYAFKNATATVVGTGTGCILDPVISPLGGFGYDQKQDLIARVVMINVKLLPTDVPDFSARNDFRRFGLVVYPLKYIGNTILPRGTMSILEGSALVTGSGTFFTEDLVVGDLVQIESGNASHMSVVINIADDENLTLATVSPSTIVNGKFVVLYSAMTGTVNNRMNITNISGTFNGDEKIYGQTSGAEGTIIEYDSGSETITYFKDHDDNNVPFSPTETIVGPNGLATIVSISNPEIIRNSGNIIFNENRIPVIRNETQTETITIIVEL